MHTLHQTQYSVEGQKVQDNEHIPTVRLPQTYLQKEDLAGSLKCEPSLKIVVDLGLVVNESLENRNGCLDYFQLLNCERIRH